MSQKAQIFEHLKLGKGITPLEALEKFGCFRLGARIFELINYHGCVIKSVMVEDNGKRYSKYSLLSYDHKIAKKFKNKAVKNKAVKNG